MYLNPYSDEQIKVTVWAADRGKCATDNQTSHVRRFLNTFPRSWHWGRFCSKVCREHDQKLLASHALKSAERLKWSRAVLLHLIALKGSCGIQSSSSGSAVHYVCWWLKCFITDPAAPRSHADSFQWNLRFLHNAARPQDQCRRGIYLSHDYGIAADAL